MYYSGKRSSDYWDNIVACKLKNLENVFGKKNFFIVYINKN
jgi:hypothetical protein